MIVWPSAGNPTERLHHYSTSAHLLPTCAHACLFQWPKMAYICSMLCYVDCAGHTYLRIDKNVAAGPAVAMLALALPIGEGSLTKTVVCLAATVSLGSFCYAGFHPYVQVRKKFLDASFSWIGSEGRCPRGGPRCSTFTMVF